MGKKDDEQSFVEVARKHTKAVNRLSGAMEKLADAVTDLVDVVEDALGVEEPVDEPEPSAIGHAIENVAAGIGAAVRRHRG